MQYQQQQKYKQFHPFIQIHIHKLEMFKINQRLKMYINLCVIHFLIICTSYQTMHYLPNKCKPLPNKFRKRS